MKRSSLLAAPYLLGLAMLVIGPAVLAFAISFADYSGLGPPESAGFENYRRMLDDDLFWLSLRNSLIYVAISVPVRLVAATALALLLARRSRGAAIARPAVYSASVIPDAAYALLWLWLLNPIYGPVAALLGTFGDGSTGLLTDPWVTRVAIAGMGALQIGEAFVIALAARRMIPTSLYEVAAVDGAKPLRILAGITIPLMAPVLALLALRDLILSFQVSFVPALLITEGGPRYATTYLPLYIYQQGFGYFRYGYTAAMSVVLFALTAGVIGVMFLVARRWRLT